MTQASIYNNHASVRADDIYSTGLGTEGCTVQLGETSDDWKLDCGDTVDNWYIDSEKMGEGTARWNAHPGNGDVYAVPYTQRTDLKGVLTLKAAHPLMYTLKYDVTVVTCRKAIRLRQTRHWSMAANTPLQRFRPACPARRTG